MLFSLAADGSPANGWAEELDRIEQAITEHASPPMPSASLNGAGGRFARWKNHPLLTGDQAQARQDALLAGGA